MSGLENIKLKKIGSSMYEELMSEFIAPEIKNAKDFEDLKNRLWDILQQSCAICSKRITLDDFIIEDGPNRCPKCREEGKEATITLVKANHVQVGWEH